MVKKNRSEPPPAQGVKYGSQIVSEGIPKVVETLLKGLSMNGNSRVFEGLKPKLGSIFWEKLPGSGSVQIPDVTLFIPQGHVVVEGTGKKPDQGGEWSGLPDKDGAQYQIFRFHTVFTFFLHF